MTPIAGFNKLERAVLDMVKELYRDPVLSAQINSARFKERKWTGVGYYTEFKVPPSVPRLNCKFPIMGPWLEGSTDIELGGRAILWGEDGLITTIEMWANGNHFAEDPMHFKLYTDEVDRFEIEIPTTNIDN